MNVTTSRTTIGFNAMLKEKKKAIACREVKEGDKLTYIYVNRHISTPMLSLHVYLSTHAHLVFKERVREKQ